MKESGSLTSHLAIAEEGWIDCENGFNLPARQTLVPVAVRTITGYFQDTAFWQSTRFSDAQIRHRLSILDGQEREAFILDFLHSLVWSRADLKTVVGVTAWYKVPKFKKRGS